MRDERGVVYVETLVAFFPVFALFLTTIQIADLSVARQVVQHAAGAAARAAVVVLPDDGAYYGDRENAALHDFSGLRRTDIERAADLVMRANSRLDPGPNNVTLDKPRYAEREDLTATVAANYRCMIPFVCGTHLVLGAKSTLVYQGAKYVYEPYEWDDVKPRRRPQRDPAQNQDSQDPPKKQDPNGDEDVAANDGDPRNGKPGDGRPADGKGSKPPAGSDDAPPSTKPPAVADSTPGRGPAKPARASDGNLPSVDKPAPGRADADPARRPSKDAVPPRLADNGKSPLKDPSRPVGGNGSAATKPPAKGTDDGRLAMGPPPRGRPEGGGEQGPPRPDGRRELPIAGVVGPHGELGPNGCFVAGTKVDTPTGPRLIEDIVVGDLVFSYDEDAKQTVRGRVSRTFIRQSGGVIALTVRFQTSLDQDVIVGTSNHPFYVPDAGAYVPLGDLTPGTGLLTIDGRRAVVVGLERRAGVHPVFNFEVAGEHNYYVLGSSDPPYSVLVHNRDCGQKEKHDEIQALIDEHGGDLNRLRNDPRFSENYIVDRNGVIRRNDVEAFPKLRTNAAGSVEIVPDNDQPKPDRLANKEELTPDEQERLQNARLDPDSRAVRKRIKARNELVGRRNAARAEAERLRAAGQEEAAKAKDKEADRLAGAVNRATEKIGELAVDPAVRALYGDDAVRVHTGSGPGTFDAVYRVPGDPDRYVIVESKGGGATNSSSRETRAGERVQQGTPEYRRDVIANMMNSPDPKVRELARALDAAGDDVEYIEVSQPIDTADNKTSVPTQVGAKLKPPVVKRYGSESRPRSAADEESP